MLDDSGGNSSEVYRGAVGVVRDEDHPLLILLNTRPHSMEIMIKPWNIRNQTVIRWVQEGGG